MPGRLFLTAGIAEVAEAAGVDLTNLEPQEPWASMANTGAW